MDLFLLVEQDAVRAFTEWKHPLSRDQRARVPLELVARPLIDTVVSMVDYEAGVCPR